MLLCAIIAPTVATREATKITITITAIAITRATGWRIKTPAVRAVFLAVLPPVFAADFAASLSLLDELILLDIYPAREEPIPGVTSQIIFDAVTIADKRLIRKEELLDVVAAEAGKFEVVLMVGAGNIELLVDPVKQILDKKE